MARNQKSISVKIPTAKLINALETRLVKLEQDYLAQADNEARYEKARTEWQEKIGKFAIGKIETAQDFRAHYRSYNQTLNIDFDLVCAENEFIAQPERDFEVIHSHTYKEMKEEISNALRILKMTDEEVVSTSTYNAVSRYL